MFQFHSNQYAAWRLRSGVVLSLHEGDEAPPERLLQAVWFHQRLLRDRLRTLDGRPVQVLHPGFWNRESGPDFRGAMIQFGHETPCHGDVEVDLRVQDWNLHQHHLNPNYRKVILRVVWEANAPADRPALALKSVLDAPLTELSLWLGSEAARAFPLELLGQCSAPLARLNPPQITELLEQAAFLRLQAKGARFQARARQAGWEQALWEGLFRALGYKQNLWPMQRLGELRAMLRPESQPAQLIECQARLLGTAGLLPAEFNPAQGGPGSYLRQLWDVWWRERACFQECLLPDRLWNLSGLRPANHPQRRLALAAAWLAEGTLPARLEQWCARALAPPERLPTLLDTLQAQADPFWSRHWTIGSSGAGRNLPLLGPTRATDLAMNAVLPWLWIRAVEGRNDSVRQELERRFFAWPAGQDNAVLRLARQRLLGSRPARFPQGAAAQQGLLQIVQDFCERSNVCCHECQFPELARQWPDNGRLA